MHVCYPHETLLRSVRTYTDRCGNAARSNPSCSITDMLDLGITEDCDSIVPLSVQVAADYSYGTNSVSRNQIFDN